MMKLLKKEVILVVSILLLAPPVKASDSESEDIIFSDSTKCRSFVGDSTKEFNSVKFTPIDLLDVQIGYDRQNGMQGDNLPLKGNSHQETSEKQTYIKKSFKDDK